MGRRVSRTSRAKRNINKSKLRRKSSRKVLTKKTSRKNKQNGGHRSNCRCKRCFFLKGGGDDDLWPWDDKGMQKLIQDIQTEELTNSVVDRNISIFNKLLHKDTQGGAASHDDHYESREEHLKAIHGEAAIRHTTSAYEFDEFIYAVLIPSVKYIELCCSDRLGQNIAPQDCKSGVICGKDRHLSIAHGRVPDTYDITETDELYIRSLIRVGVEDVLTNFRNGGISQKISQYLEAYGPEGMVVSADGKSFYSNLYRTDTINVKRAGSSVSIPDLHDLHKAALIGHALCFTHKQGAYATELELRWSADLNAFKLDGKKQSSLDNFDIAGIVGHTPIPLPFFGNNQLCCDTTYTTMGDRSPLNRHPVAVILNSNSNAEWAADVVFERFSDDPELKLIFPAAEYYHGDIQVDAEYAWENIKHYHINNEICANFFNQFPISETGETKYVPKNNVWKSGSKIFIGKSYNSPYPFITVVNKGRKWDIVFIEDTTTAMDSAHLPATGVVGIPLHAQSDGRAKLYRAALGVPTHSNMELFERTDQTRLILTDIEGNFEWFIRSLTLGQSWTGMGACGCCVTSPPQRPRTGDVALLDQWRQDDYSELVKPHDMTLLYCGDTWDRGEVEDYIYILEILKAFKQKGKLVCVCGNRDINKLRFLLEYIKNPLSEKKFMQAVLNLQKRLRL